MPAYAVAGDWDELRRRFDYAFKPYNGGFFMRPVLEQHVVTAGETIDILDIPLQLIDQDHGYARSLGLRIQNFAYCTDVVRLDEQALDALQNLDVLIVDCFTSPCTRATAQTSFHNSARFPGQSCPFMVSSAAGPSHPTHANLAQVEAWVDRLQPKRTILTHMGPDMDYRRLADTLPAHIEPGYDGLVIYL